MRLEYCKLVAILVHLFDLVINKISFNIIAEDNFSFFMSNHVFQRLWPLPFRIFSRKNICIWDLYVWVWLIHKKDAMNSLSDIYFDSTNSPWQDNIYAKGNCKKSLAHIICMSSNASLRLLQITDCQGHRLSLSQYSFYYCLTYR